MEFTTINPTSYRSYETRTGISNSNKMHMRLITKYAVTKRVSVKYKKGRIITIKQYSPLNYSIHLFYQLSVRKADAGSPAALNKLGCAVFENAKRTATGCFIFLADTITISSFILASAGTNT